MKKKPETVTTTQTCDERVLDFNVFPICALPEDQLNYLLSLFEKSEININYRFVEAPVKIQKKGFIEIERALIIRFFFGHSVFYDNDKLNQIYKAVQTLKIQPSYFFEHLKPVYRQHAFAKATQSRLWLNGAKFSIDLESVSRLDKKKSLMHMQFEGGAVCSVPTQELINEINIALPKKILDSPAIFEEIGLIFKDILTAIYSRYKQQAEEGCKKEQEARAARLSEIAAIEAQRQRAHQAEMDAFVAEDLKKQAIKDDIKRVEAEKQKQIETIAEARRAKEAEAMEILRVEAQEKRLQEQRIKEQVLQAQLADKEAKQQALKAPAPVATPAPAPALYSSGAEKKESKKKQNDRVAKNSGKIEIVFRGKINDTPPLPVAPRKEERESVEKAHEPEEENFVFNIEKLSKLDCDKAINCYYGYAIHIAQTVEAKVYEGHSSNADQEDILLAAFNSHMALWFTNFHLLMLLTVNLGGEHFKQAVATHNSAAHDILRNMQRMRTHIREFKVCDAIPPLKETAHYNPLTAAMNHRDKQVPALKRLNDAALAARLHSFLRGEVKEEKEQALVDPQQICNDSIKLLQCNALAILKNHHRNDLLSEVDIANLGKNYPLNLLAIAGVVIWLLEPHQQRIIERDDKLQQLLSYCQRYNLRNIVRHEEGNPHLTRQLILLCREVQKIWGDVRPSLSDTEFGQIYLRAQHAAAVPASQILAFGSPIRAAPALAGAAPAAGKIVNAPACA